MVLDSSAVIAWLRSEPEAVAIERLLAANSECHASAVTVFECRTVVWGRFGLHVLGELDRFLARTDPVVHPFDKTQSSLAFAAYRRYGKGSGHKARLNLGDCAAYALATSLDLPLLYKGDDFRHTDVRPALS
jgi:ribonuclease VapC